MLSYAYSTVQYLRDVQLGSEVGLPDNPFRLPHLGPLHLEVDRLHRIMQYSTVQ